MVGQKLTYEALAQRVRELEKKAFAFKSAEKVLHQREQEYRALVENNPDLIARFDRELRHLYINPAIEAVSKKSVKDFIGKTNREIGIPDDLADFWDSNHVKVFETGRESVIEWHYTTPDGPGYFQTRIVPEFSKDGSVETVLAITRDITKRRQAEEELRQHLDRLEAVVDGRTAELRKANRQLEREVEERKRAEEMLRESEENYRLVVENVPAFIAIMDNRRRYRFVNNNYASLFGLAPRQLIGKHALEIIGEDIYAEASPHMEEVLSGETTSWELLARFEDGQRRWLSAIYVPRYSGAGEVDGFYSLITDIDGLKRGQEKLKQAFTHIERLKNMLQRENIYLREEIALKFRHDSIIGQSDAIKRVLAQCEQVAGTESTVLLSGETGTGKELMARAIHGLSRRKERSLIKVNCAALPSTLMESELFGREKGAYTGALTRQMGRFEVADGSTIFLDEIGELPLEVQAKLLRVLQDGEFERLGSSKTVKVDIRVIAATNRNLAGEVRENRFREDLYYRINVFPITVPPLRDRREDIPRLVWAFIREFEKTMGKRIETIPRRTMEILQHHRWPGNVRELRNMIERAMIVSQSDALNVEVSALTGAHRPADATLEDMERRHIDQILKKTGWRIKGKNGAAEILGLKPTTLHSRMKKLGIKRPPK